MQTILEEFKDEPLSGRAKKKLSILRRRAQFLQQRIEEATEKGKDLTYDKSEMSALNWVIERILLLEPPVEQSDRSSLHRIDL
ncbi:MAG: hypothetical protein HY456_02550 [Parcubacteria group bacterium]|nr:hypothetical protein [Parcubacteria group bacterium]